MTTLKRSLCKPAGFPLLVGDGHPRSTTRWAHAGLHHVEEVSRRDVLTKVSAALVLVLLVLTTAALIVATQTNLDPLAKFRQSDGRLNIPGRALTPELQHLLFHGNDLQVNLRIIFPTSEHSAYPTMQSIPSSFDVPNPNVFVRPSQETTGWGSAIGHQVREWFPPVDWNAVREEVLTSIGRGIGALFDFFTVNAKADTLSVDSTTVTLVEPPAATCTTSQTAAIGDNAVLVMLSNRPETAYTSVTYGSVSLSLIAGTASSGTGVVRSELWFYQGALPSGTQTMTATLASGTAKHVCATILLRGVAGASPTTGGLTASGTTANPSIAISTAAGELAFAVMAKAGTGAPTAVTGTGAAATALYGIAPTRCTSAGTNLCGSGANMPNPGSAITWTAPANDWVVSAVRIVPAADCSVGGGNCYRIGAGGAWNGTSNWSNTSGGASCTCTPAATDNAYFDANPTGATTLTAATTIASIDMAGFTGTLDTTASNWALTVDGALEIQGTLLARNSTITVTGDVTVLTAASFINFSGSTWTVTGTWTNASTSASWSIGTATATFNSSSAQTMTFAALPGNAPEFNNVIFNSGASTVTFTMSTNALVWSGTLTVRGDTGTTTMATSDRNLIGGALVVGDAGVLMANASTVSVSDLTMNGGTSGTITLTSAVWTVSGSWNTSSASTFLSADSSVTFVGTSGSISLAAGQQFDAVTIAGFLTLTSDLTATSLMMTTSNTLTMTNHAITFNTLTVAGTVVDGSVNVSDLTVANSDTTALVTIEGFTAWSGGSSYAWTHTSSETSQTITWTIGGNTAGTPFTVTKDGSAFASGAVNGSGQVVFTMLGSDPDMRVSVGAPVVIPPPTGGWWQTPYLLVILPPAILLGVAMIVRRQRWRPAKAFLVDERGQMIREFTLNPSCRVTYDEAVQAGVLDAVEKPVKVQKYRGQTVRGNALAVVLLAYGPVTLEQVEFAREMLVQVQDKFEDAVKERLEEARAREADLDGKSKDIERRQAGIETRTAELDAMEQEIGRARSKLAADEAAIVAKEIELEAREQSLEEKEDEVRTQAEENARRPAELAGREEALEFDAAKVDNVRAEIDARKTELGNLAKELDGKAVHLREEEARRADELRTWQTTLESQQALLKDQRETFEREAASARESWADRLMRVERREIEVKEQEETIHKDIERLTGDREEVTRREKAAAEALRTASQMRTGAVRAMKDIEQGSLEIDSRDRALQEDAGRYSVELATRTESLNALEDEIAATRSELEKDRAALTERIRQTEMDLQTTADGLAAKARKSEDREARVAAMEESLRSNEARLEQERAAVQDVGKQLESHQLELAQLRDRYESESTRVRTEAEAIRQSLAVRESEIQKERARIERDSAALQETLGGKAKELAVREKALAAREEELRAKKEDLEARIRELESKEGQAEARTTELSAQAMAMVRREQDLNALAAQFDQTLRKLEPEEGEKRRQWESLQTTIRNQQAQLNATEESRAAQTAKRLEDIEGRERTFRAATTQLEMDRSKLDAQTKALNAKAAEAEAASKRSDARLVELKTKENEILRARQSFESERSTWSVRRTEELKQLEATRDATAVQAQQTERLIGESQRRALVAGEAENAAKRAAAELTAQQTLLEKRRSDADKSEQAAQAQVAQLREMSKRFTAKETEIAAGSREMEARLAKLAVSEKENATTSADLRAKKATIDQESARLSSLVDQSTARQKDLASRASTLEAKQAQAAKKEQTLATELQRADNLMEVLTKKDAEIRNRDESVRALESELTRRRAELAARDAQLADGTRNLEKTRQEIEAQRVRTEEDLRAATALRGEAEKLRVQAEAMQAEVSKNLRFLQKKALDVLDKGEKLRERESHIEHAERALDTRAEILEGKERTMDADRTEFDTKTAKLQTELDGLRARIAEMEKGGGPSKGAMDEWKKDVENRVKIIQKKTTELLDRERKLRDKEEELRAMAQQLGVTL